MERDADVVVVGAGIVGCATAYFLARRGARVVVVERGSVPGEQSRKNWGFVRQQGRDPVEMPLVMEAHRLWRVLPVELVADIEWIQGGNLAPAADDRRMARFEAWLPVAREFGLQTHLLRARDLGAVVPGLAGDWVGGMHTPGDGHADPEKTTDAFARAAVAYGASLHLECAVQGVSTRAGAVSGVVTEHGEIRTPTVVCAAGAWSARLARTLGLDLPQHWVRGTVARTTPVPAVSACAVWAPGVAFRQCRDGSFTIAAGGALDHDVTLDSLRQLRFFLPNFWKNKALFRFHVGRPLLASLAAALPGSAARRPPLVCDRRLEPPPNRAKAARSRRSRWGTKRAAGSGSPRRRRHRTIRPTDSWPASTRRCGSPPSRPGRCATSCTERRPPPTPSWKPRARPRACSPPPASVTCSRSAATTFPGAPTCSPG